MERFTTSDGVQVAYEYDDSAPEGEPPVVLLHGFAVSGQLNFGGPGLIDALADDDRRTLVIDARGHGDSDGPRDPDAYGEARMAQDVAELLDELGLEEIDLLGYSMGAVTAAILASTDERVRRLVLGGVGVGLVDFGGVDQREMPRDIIVQAMAAPSRAEIDHPLGHVWRAFAETVDADTGALALQAAAMHESPIALSEITAQTLVVAGTKDGLANDPQVLAAAIPGARTLTLEADHLGIVRHPDYNPALVAFLGGRS